MAGGMKDLGGPIICHDCARDIVGIKVRTWGVARPGPDGKNCHVCHGARNATGLLVEVHPDTATPVYEARGRWMREHDQQRR